MHPTGSPSHPRCEQSQPVDSKMEGNVCSGPVTAHGESTNTAAQDSPASPPSEPPTRGPSPAADEQSQSEQQAPFFDPEQMSDPSEIILAHMVHGGAAAEWCFQNGPIAPPITAESLDELSWENIINNPRLRQDCNFDYDLHFRPNLDGAKGKKKMLDAKTYWRGLKGELFVLNFVLKHASDPRQAHNHQQLHAIILQSQKRLPSLLCTARDIILRVVRPDVRDTVSQQLDMDDIIHRISIGTCDLVHLSTNIAHIIEVYGTGSRTLMVEEMRDLIVQGVCNEKPEDTVAGLKQLLHILEGESLDIANRQIRNKRQELVSSSVSFLRAYNTDKVLSGRIDAGEQYLWLEDEVNALMDENRPSGPMNAVTSALLKGLLFDDGDHAYPKTFKLDDHRLRGLRLDIWSRIYHAICCDTLLLTARFITPPPPHELAAAVSALHTSVTAIVGPAGRFMEWRESIATEIMSLVLQLNGNNRTLFDGILYSFAEQQLRQNLHPTSSAFKNHAHAFYERLRPRLNVSVRQHARLSELSLQRALLGPAPMYTYHQGIGYGAVLRPAPMAGPVNNPDDDLVLRLTHIIVLHYQIWGPLVYYGTAGVTPLPQDDEDDCAGSMPDEYDDPPRSPPNPTGVSHATSSTTSSNGTVHYGTNKTRE